MRVRLISPFPKYGTVSERASRCRRAAAEGQVQAIPREQFRGLTSTMEKKRHGIPPLGGGNAVPGRIPVKPRYREKIRISTLRFSNLPFAVLLLAIGLVSP
jgi:hypothetical protein